MNAVDTEITSLGMIVEFLDSRRQPVKSTDRNPGPYPYYGANGQQGTISDYIFDEPLVLLAEDGGHFFEPSRGIAYKISGKTWVNNHAHVLRPKASVDIDYLSLALKHLDVTPYLTGTTRAKLTKAAASRIQIPLPPLPEQKRIAAILDKADSLRTKRRETIKQLDKLARSVFIEMFGDPVTNPKSWNLERIGSVVATCHNWNPRRSNIESFDYIDLSSIDKESKSISSVDRYLSNEAPSRARQIVKRGDVLVATVRPNLNGVALVTEEYDGMTASTGYCVLRPAKNKVTPEYLFQWVRTEVFINKMIDVAIGANYPAISDVKVKESILPIPPIDLQQRFASIVTSIENHKTRRQTQLAELDTLFTSLQARAFKGEL